MSRRLTCLICLVSMLLVVGTATALTPMEMLGKSLFFDEDLSFYANQSCATCHAPSVGWVGPDSSVNAAGSVYEGSLPGEFGDRKPPAAAYGGNSPILYFDDYEGLWVGGMFWDGRATGWTLGDPLAEQALGPFLNPKEQALPSPGDVIDIVKASDYTGLFESVWGPGSLDDDLQAYEYVGRSIAAYERSSEVSPYSSKYDAYVAGMAKLTGAEKKGMDLFFGKANCSLCHMPPDFTDFTYDNLGVPKNPLNPVYDWFGSGFIDPGLGGFLQAAGYDEPVYGPEWGKHKVPTLRNVDLRLKAKGQFVKAYGHNGYFKSLKEIVHFYNTRDVPGAGLKGKPWPPAEYAATVNTEELGNLGLTDQEEDNLVAFMETLSDGYKP
jgi:cytochrome c peroxidase